MKQIVIRIIALISLYGYSQIPGYYTDVNLTLSGQALQNELATKVTNTHTTFLSYTPGVWDALKQTDLDPTNSSKVVLVYGYNDTDGNLNTDRTRGVNNNGGGSSDWNREHVYPKSLGNPNLGTSGPGADAHHLRPADVSRNSSRGNRKFADGSGNSNTTSQGHWYPGDEFKGDVARMMMYMYIRYGNRCLPTNVGVGTVASSDNNMLQLFLEWNAEDPVSTLELQRNPILENIQGNRNPFIDNPAFATKIWGGPQAEDRFGDTGGGDDITAPTVPGSLIASDTTETSTELSWSASTDNVAVTGYDIYRNGSLLTTITTTSYTVSGLTSDTSYSFYVRAKDAAGNVSSNSNTVNITTQSGGNNLCNSTVTTLPYKEDLETNFGAWSQANSSDDFNWDRRSGGTPSNNTGPSAAASGSYYMYMESSSPNYSNKRAILYSPCFDLTSETQAVFSFKYHLYGASNMGSLAVEASLNGTTWSSVWSISGNQGNSWKTANINLVDYIGKKVQLRFNGVTGATWQGDMAVDEIDLSTNGGGGGSTTDEVNLRITFDNYPEETSWEIKNASNQIVYSGGAYGSQADGSTINISRTLDEGCYTLTIKDVYGDGICCSYGNGSYALTNGSGTTLASGASFGSQEVKNFCVGASSKNFLNSNEGLGVFDFYFYPNPVKNNMFIQSTVQQNVAFKIVNHLGQIVKEGHLKNENLQLNTLTSGLYFISLSDEKQTITKKFTKE
ncbi:endonuclease [Aquimarina sp. 2201CG5-10]|uniref:endonuclease n=1 Tax=Aquimarina callyspongiae TaxID=3098150 RepID=UPI002AB34B05|nr:endonuclease [Aquimarina sp. 2201CG5-10]MDY8135360.1 endonuclease [Aquimarina sp. 2201CG5-10]